MYTVNAVHHSHQQWLVAEWLGVGATVTARAREWNFPLFLSVLDVTNTFVWHVDSTRRPQH